jgi:folate-binding protein YgfZ
MDNQVGCDAFELYRIRRGIPRYDPGVMGECNPLELNLWNQISFSKGCYIGQEVIARLDTYKKIQRTLCSFRSDMLLVPSGSCRISHDGRDLGIGTNCARNDNDNGKFAGLAVVRKEFARLGAQYAAGENAVSIFIDRVFEHNEISDGNNISSR